MSLDYHQYVADVAANDVDEVLPRDVAYKGSWQRRGGVGIFNTAFARKWDRIEAAAETHGYDIIKAWQADPGANGLIDDIRDLRRYLLLFEALLIQRHGLPKPPNYPAADRARLETARQGRVLDSQPASGMVRGGGGGGAAGGKVIWGSNLYEHDPHNEQHLPVTVFTERRTATHLRRAHPQMLHPAVEERRMHSGKYHQYSYGRREGDDPNQAITLKEKRREKRD